MENLQPCGRRRIEDKNEVNSLLTTGPTYIGNLGSAVLSPGKHPLDVVDETGNENLWSEEIETSGADVLFEGIHDRTSRK